jgi:hypothetical protein
VILAAPPDSTAIDRAIERVLSGPQYAGARKSWLTRLRDEVRTWVLERLAGLFEGGAGSIIAWTLVAIVAVVAVLLLTRLLRTISRGRSQDTGSNVAIQIERTPAAWLREADAALRSGRFAEAVRCGYRAVVARLALTGAVDEVPGRTVGEYRAQVGQRRPDLVAPFAEASDVFERVWYAQRPATEGDVREVVGVAQTLDGGP